MIYYLIHPSQQTTLDRVQSASPAQVAEARSEASGSPDVDVVAGVARIKIEGMLLDARDRFYDMFGIVHTSYADIVDQVRSADADKSVKSIEFHVNSGGGVAGNEVIKAAEAISAAVTPTTALVGGMAASAAYWLASQADTLELAGPASIVGSIGVATERAIDPTTVSITSTDAPEKRPDAATKEGQAQIRKPLDAIHELFVSDVARGRGVSAETVNSDFGRGGVLMGSDAVSAGMADKVHGAVPKVEERARVAVMDLSTLKAEHPELVALIVKRERARVNVHLALAKESGNLNLAMEHIEDGSDPDAIATGQHEASRMQAANLAATIAAQAPDLSAAGANPAASPEPLTASANPQMTQVERDAHDFFVEYGSPFKV